MKRLAALLVSLAVVSLSASAELPGRVARISLIEGEASVFADPEQGWEGARVNTPLTSENSVWTEPGARVEVRFGSAALRLGETTQLDILQLDDDVFRAHVVRGALTVRIRDLVNTETFLVATPEARFQLRGNGRYRVDTDPARGESRLTVLSGNARLEAAGGYISIDTGRSVRVSGGERPRYELETAYSTALDEWALARDRRFEEREAARYVPPEMTGWEDLDDYGVWRNEPEYGAVWFPTRVEAGWAPYRYGRWTWVRPWGWAWVDDAPWGYAPFHYGRWVTIGNRWGWYPGRYTTRPVWAPALVGWVGQPGWSISISTGPTNVVGWYPLSPYDRYQPWYTSNVTYVNNVNHIVIPPRRDRDRRDDRRDDHRSGYRDNRDRGATVVPREHFGSRRPVQNVLAPVAGEVVAAQPAVPGSSVLPSRSEWRTRNRPAQATPRAPAGGQPVASPRPASPLAPAPGAPTSKPMLTTPAAPAYPASPAAPPSRVARPAPVETAPRAKPAEPVTREKPAEPAEPATRTKPAQARGADARAPQAVERTVPAQPQPQPQPAMKPAPAAPSSRVARPAPAETAPPVKPAEPVTRVKPAEPAEPAMRTKPAQARGADSRAPQAVERTAPPPPQPSARPAPPAQEKPARSPGRPVEKPADPAGKGD